MEWQPIEDLDIEDNKMFLAIGLWEEEKDGFSYISDPYCVWKLNDKFIKWPITEKPTHFCYIPEFKDKD